MSNAHRQIVIEQYETLLHRFGWQVPKKGLITITGGEPFADPGLPALLETLYNRREHMYFALLSNGILISDQIIDMLRSSPPRFVQVSLDGMRKTHDTIRGEGTFDKAVQGIRLLTESGIRTTISFTAHRKNYSELPKVAKLAKQLGVARIWTDRMIPQGEGWRMADEVLTPEETQSYCRILRNSRFWSALTSFGKTEVAAIRALQFLKCETDPYACTAGESLLAVMPDGVVYPCRRLPQKVGRIPDQSLAEIYTGHPFLKELRNRNRISSGCESCRHRHRCRGGARCMSFAVSGSAFTADPGCWKKRVTAGTI